MQYSLAQFGDLQISTENKARLLNGDPGMETAFYHLKDGASLNVTFASPQDFLKNPAVMYIVLEGAVDICEGEDHCIVKAGESIVLHPKHNFSVWAREVTSLLCVSNDGGGKLDEGHVELLESVKLAERNDVYVIGHNYRVSRYAVLIMQVVAPERAGELLRLASGFHDVGKVRLDPAILNKPGRLTNEEFDHIKLHPVYSWEMLRKHLPEEIANIARWHHEKLDGTGYPDGISGDSIPLESRVIAVADIFDALTTSRCYRSAFTFPEALDILRKDVEAGKLDARTFNALRLLVERGTLREGVDNTLRNREE